MKNVTSGKYSNMAYKRKDVTNNNSQLVTTLFTMFD